MFKRFINWMFPKCQHNKNRNTTTWLAEDGTPMVESYCLDCGWRDYGHVYADSKDYECRVIIIRQGETLVNDLKN